MINIPEIDQAQKNALIEHCNECLAIVDRADENIRKSEKVLSPYMQNLLKEHQTQRINYSITLNYLEQPKIIPYGLHVSTAELVLAFAKALAEKLHRSEQKYGWSDGWKDEDWQKKCLADFHHHIGKGDPRDVAAYCAFMWYHGWSTVPDMSNDGYVSAFYEIAKIMGIGAQPISPKEVFEAKMRPVLESKFK